MVDSMFRYKRKISYGNSVKTKGYGGSFLLNSNSSTRTSLLQVSQILSPIGNIVSEEMSLPSTTDLLDIFHPADLVLWHVDTVKIIDATVALSI